ncbi:MAG: hypothetical protein HZA48_02440 [Planctomycetes bacterium]|nr:hypothetical protein [Planctomycetota bacterium]
MQFISKSELERRIKMWADVTALSFDLYIAMLKKKHPKSGKPALRKMMLEDFLNIGLKNHERIFLEHAKRI